MKQWRFNGEQVIVKDGNGWHEAKAEEILSAAFGPESEAIREGTGLRFGRMALTASLVIHGALPDEIWLNLEAARGVKSLPLPATNVQGVVQDGRWHPLNMDSVNSCRKFLAAHDLNDARSISLGQYLALIADPNGHGLLFDQTVKDDGAELPIAERDFASLGLAIGLFPYQQVGAEYLVAMADRGVGVLLADQMGLGKTAQAIAVLLDQVHLGLSLVVCPASLLRNWAREFDQFAPGLRALVHSGRERTGLATGFAGYDVIISSYETVAGDFSFFRDILWNIVVLDEAQYVRNPDATRSQAVKALKRRVSIALTGTPVENKLLDLWSIAEFVVPALLGHRDSFEAAYPDEMERAESLGRVIAPVTLRRLVAEVAQDLPDLIQIETAFQLSDEELDRYTELDSSSATPLETITRRRVLCAHADGYGWGAGGQYSPKVEHAMRIMAEAFDEGQKVLVFASFQQSLDNLLNLIGRKFPMACRGEIDGRVEVSDRQVIIDLFTEFDGPGVLLMNPRAAGVGLNITAANHVIHFNPEWNPALTSQASARAYRRRQTLPVTVHHLFYEQTVEEDALSRSDWKRALARHVDVGTTGDNGGDFR
ncbi:DEAD/DEAH box helicase [Micrococcaceae bacterium Sec5.1]